MKKRLLIVLALAVALLMSLQISVFAAEEQELVFWELVEDTSQSNSLARSVNVAWKSDSDSYYGQLSAKAKRYYDQIEELFQQEANGQITIPQDVLSVNGEQKAYWSLGAIAIETLTGTGDPQAAFTEWVAAEAPVVSQAGNAFVLDHPEYFWIRTDLLLARKCAGHSSGSSFEITCEILLNYGVQAELDTMQTRQKMQAQIDAVVDKLICETENLTDEQKIAYWDNWLAVNNRYNGGALADNYISTDATPWCVIGALLDGYQPVCEGYAKALQLLCHQAGIPCVQQSGVANGGGHMWVAVKLGDNWYFCDPTWDDPNQDASSWNYSRRSHLLTVQPDTHEAIDYNDLGTPPICSTAFFEQREVSIYREPYYESVVPSEWRLDENDGICGLEIGTNTMVITLYGEGGKFLGIGTCESMKWSANEDIYLAPSFEQDILKQAKTAMRFNLRDVVNWAPAAAAATIR